MAYKVTKNFGKYSIVKDDWLEKWIIVDVESGQSVYGGYHLGTLKEYAGALESGLKPPTDFDWSYDYGNPIDMPKSLKAKQAQLQKQAQAQAASEASGIAKPIGSHAPSIVEVTDKGAYKVVKMSDGTYGMLVPSTGQSKLGMSSKAGASKSGNLAAKKHAESILSGQGVDPGSNAVDTLIDLYEGRVREMYGQAYREMSAKHAKFMDSYMSQNAEMAAKYEAGEISYADLKAWRSGQATMMQRNTQMVNSLADDLAKADKHAMAMLNGYMVPAYSENFAFATYQIEKAAKVSTSFSLHNRNAVVNILKDPDKALLPTVDDAADVAWCRRKVSSCIAQSILQGDSVPAAAARLESVVGMSANSAVRAARTALTGAQNLGRLDAGERAREMGIELMKQWVSTADDRTRDSHVMLDRETVELDEDFSNGCGYPGDPSGDPSEVYNCRCAMRFVLPGHEYDDIPETTREGVDYEEWKAAHTVDEEAEKEKLQGQLDSIEAQKADIMSALPPDETYDANDVLKHDASLSNWENEQQAIADSKAYTQKKLDEAWEHYIDEGEFESKFWADKAEHYQSKLDAIYEYDKKGKEYFEAKQAVQGQLDALDAQKKEIGAKLAEFNKGAGPYSHERVDAAIRFTSKQDADDALRGISGRAWREATEAEKAAINKYTGSWYEEYNMPLNGFDGSYRNFVGLDKVDINNNGCGQDVRDMTRMLERTHLEEDMWVRRGVSGRTMSSFFLDDAGTDLTSLSQAELDKFVGVSNRIGSFQSCGTISGTGFDKPVNIDIFLPKNSEAMYVEPISRCGAGDGIDWDGLSKQHSFSREFETIIQRGGSYTCTAIEKDAYGVVNITLEHHVEDGYWKFQQ